MYSSRKLRERAIKATSKFVNQGLELDPENKGFPKFT